MNYSSTTLLIEKFLQPEIYLLFIVFIFFGFIFYKLALKKISEKRHANLQNRFANITFHLVLSALLSLIYWQVLKQLSGPFYALAAYYVSLIALVIGAIAFVKASQILAYLILFFQNISQGIPRLIANLLTVAVSIIVTTYLLSEVLAIHLTTMLATSAVFSLVLGLALQDTLGNLFSGVALQIGQAYKIGDWIEIHTDSKNWLGQVQEITWRATFLSTFADEWVMIPNKTMAQSQIIILSHTHKPVRHNLLFRISFTDNLESIKNTLTQTVQSLEGVASETPVRALVIETTESWITLKIFYSIRDFSLKYRLADQAWEACLTALRAQGVTLASSQISIVNRE